MRPPHRRTDARRHIERASSADALDVARHAAEAHARARADLERAIVAAVMAGATSAEVGAVVGMTRQGVLNLVARLS